ncbi:MAG: DUF3011 domain-containing protein [Xanthomonadales bacterium]|nr:DUF3011 domain-containing protein [Xanthomonadales bacterium]
MQTRIFAMSLFAAGAVALIPAPAHAQRGWGDSGGTIRCDARGGGRTGCPAPIGRGSEAYLVRQLSAAPCVPGRTWGWDQQGVWVSQGCSGEFAVRRAGGGPPPRPPVPVPPGGGPGWGGPGEVVRCESDRYRYRMCPVRVGRRGVELLRQTSRTRCEFGRTWGWDRRGIWVDGGCAADFRVR